MNDESKRRSNIRGLLEIKTTFSAEKIARETQARFADLPAPWARLKGITARGYEIRHGRVTHRAGAQGWIHLDDCYGREDDGALDAEARVLGTSLHGLFERPLQR